MSIVEILVLLIVIGLVVASITLGVRSVAVSWHSWRGVRVLALSNLYVLRLRLGVVTLTLAKDDLADRLEAYRAAGRDIVKGLDPESSARQNDGQ